MQIGIFHIMFAALVTYFAVYYGSGLFLRITGYVRRRKNISCLEKEIMKMEHALGNESAYEKLDSRQKKELRNKLARYMEALSDIRRNRSD